MGDVKISYPDIKIDGMDFTDSNYACKEKRWSAVELYKQVEKEKSVAYDVPLAFIDMRCMPFTVDDVDDFIFQMKRVLNTDLDIPIIFDCCGRIADGWHRVVKAMIEGKKTIKGYRLKEMPDNYLIDKNDP